MHWGKCDKQERPENHILVMSDVTKKRKDVLKRVRMSQIHGHRSAFV